MQTNRKPKQASSVKKTLGFWAYWPVYLILILGVSLTIAKLEHPAEKVVIVDNSKHVCNEKQLERAYLKGYQDGNDQR